jgi:hypothetical protein
MKMNDTIPGTYGYDLAFLNKYIETIVLSDDQGKAQIVIIPGWQARFDNVYKSFFIKV